MSNTTENTSLDDLEAKSDAITGVLNAHKVFGVTDEASLNQEKRNYKEKVSQYALSGDRYYLEIFYDSGITLVINTRVVEGVAKYWDITAYEFARTTIDCDALNTDIQAIFDSARQD